jgi:hypothetical protein
MGHEHPKISRVRNEALGATGHALCGANPFHVQTPDQLNVSQVAIRKTGAPLASTLRRLHFRLSAEGCDHEGNDRQYVARKVANSPKSLL